MVKFLWLVLVSDETKTHSLCTVRCMHTCLRQKPTATALTSLLGHPVLDESIEHGTHVLRDRI